MTRRHLLKAPGRSRAACGLSNPKVHTTNPAEVTCLTCRGSLYMADLEIRMSQPDQPKRRSNRRRAN